MNRLMLSIVVPTFNNENIIQDFMECLERQSYPPEQMEILVVDGGSTDRTREITARYHTQIIDNPYTLTEPGVNLGMDNARGELIMILAVDNFLTNPNDLEKIVRVFQDNTVYAAFPKHDSNATDTLYTKYINTFTDPFNHFIYGYAANARTFHRVYRVLESNTLYDIYDFASNTRRPLIALAQGFTIRSEFRRKPEEQFDDCKPILDLLDQRKKIAFVHSVSLFHHTVSNCKHFNRKQRWAVRNAMKKEDYGIIFRFCSLSKGQRLRVRLWPFYAFSVLLPLARSLYGIVRDRELIWLFHPIICLQSAGVTIGEMISYYLNKDRKVSRQI